MVGEVVDVKEAVSIVVNEENVLNLLLLLLENVMEPSRKNKKLIDALFNNNIRQVLKVTKSQYN